MTWAENLNVNIFSMLLVFIVLLNNGFRHRRARNSRIFNLIIIFDFLLMLLDVIGTAAAQQHSGEISRLVWFFNIARLMLTVGVASTWFMYVCYRLDDNGVRKRTHILTITAFIMAAAADMALLMVPYEYFGGYGISNSGLVMRVCHHGVAALGTCMFIGSAVVAEYVRGHEKAKEVRQECLYLVAFSILAALGVLVQNIYPQFNSASTCVSLAILYVYISMQNKQVITDSLTGVNNRRELEAYIERRSRQSGDWGLLMVDVDDFKEINDNAGHKQGDDALWNVADILRSIFDGESDFIARFGGDEFVVCGEWNSQECIEGLRKDIDRRVEEFNNQKVRQYKLSLSTGGALWSECGRDKEGIMETADKRMYEEKLRKKKPGGADHEYEYIYPD